MRHFNKGAFRDQVNFLRRQFLQDGDKPVNLETLLELFKTVEQQQQQQQQTSQEARPEGGPVYVPTSAR